MTSTSWTCPACNGKGEVTKGYYVVDPKPTGLDTCRSCKGEGVLRTPIEVRAALHAAFDPNIVNKTAWSSLP